METGPESLKYNLPLISRNDFDMFHTFVQSVFDEGRQRFNPRLNIISNQWVDFPEPDDVYLSNCTSLGVCMEPPGAYQSYFNIWINPSYKDPVFKFWMTLAHELTHGYVGAKYGHNAHWRRWFYRVMWHLNETFLIPEPEDSLFSICICQEFTYNQSIKLDCALTVREAFSKAEKEHDKIKTNFIRRMNFAPSMDCSRV